MNKQQRKTWDDCMALLMSELPKEDAETVYDKAVLRWQDFSAKMDGESESRKKLAVNAILPRVALYAALKEDGYPADQIMKKYIEEISGPAMHEKYARLEKIPGFFWIFRKAYMSYTDKSDWWNCESVKTPDGFKLDMHTCLWKDCCDIAGYPEVCSYFCDSDDITYSNLSKVGFRRTQTLGKGGEKCDFEFYRKDSNTGKNK